MVVSDTSNTEANSRCCSPAEARRRITLTAASSSLALQCASPLGALMSSCPDVFGLIDAVESSNNVWVDSPGKLRGRSVPQHRLGSVNPVASLADESSLLGFGDRVRHARR